MLRLGIALSFESYDDFEGRRVWLGGSRHIIKSLELQRFFL